jgi:toluene monooxygenase system ferredoxin subunit
MRTWAYATSLDELWDGEVIGTVVDETVEIVLCNVGGEVFAYDDRCPHLGGRLSNGVLDGSMLTCAAHEWVFDVRSGGGVNPAASCLRQYDVRLDGDDIFVLVERPDA